jgi:inorganic triphosphatase YgiF
MTTECEVELKFMLNGESVEKLASSALFPPGECRRREVVSTYFDTADFRIRRNNLSLRLRSVDGRYTQTVKANNAGDTGLFERDEWNRNVDDGEGPSMESLEETPIIDLLDAGGDAKLRPMFVMEIERLSRCVEYDRENSVEMALDRGVVRTGERELAIYEIEFELISGSYDRVFDLARAAAEVVPLWPSNRSKADLGYELVGCGPAPVIRKSDGRSISEAASAYINGFPNAGAAVSAPSSATLGLLVSAIDEARGPCCRSRSSRGADVSQRLSEIQTSELAMSQFAIDVLQHLIVPAVAN